MLKTHTIDCFECARVADIAFKQPFVRFQLALMDAGVKITKPVSGIAWD